MNKIFKDAVFSGREIDVDAPPADRLLQRVHFQAEHVQGWMSRSLAASDQSLGACDQLAQIEGLGQVVVGSCVEKLDDGIRTLLCSQDQDRRGVVACAQPLEQTEPVEF